MKIRLIQAEHITVCIAICVGIAECQIDFTPVKIMHKSTFFFTCLFCSNDDRFEDCCEPGR